MTAAGSGPVGDIAISEDLASDGESRSTCRRIVWSLIMLNAIALMTLIGLFYFDRDAPADTSPLLSRLRWWSQPWGEYVPIVVGKADSAASQGAALFGYLLASLTLILAVAAVFWGRGRERLALPAFGLLLAMGWGLLGTNWDVIRLRGQSAELAQHAESVSEFAQQLNHAWPDQGGEITGFGAFLAYPYGKPRTLLMLGDAHIPNTTLRVAAVERTPGQAIRFQLTGDAPNVWFEYRTAETAPTEFRGGLQQKHTPTADLEIAAKTYIVRYAITGPKSASEERSSSN
ncbi:hypothetical protein CA54_57100 [Symmachiella macrocystis]|uniref:Uncharacterized protein n=1 Tax=Symmachiella macrocystis TaxID=2527985 RepID=A0A5C6B9W0_9PLAN|nr:hypothetical protein [Symmachiella macrocystis]TWU07304.1 hypothetical protein CA54_57100 [Symmachiella macrocystis]